MGQLFDQCRETLDACEPLVALVPQLRETVDSLRFLFLDNLQPVTNRFIEIAADAAQTRKEHR